MAFLASVAPWLHHIYIYIYRDWAFYDRMFVSAAGFFHRCKHRQMVAPEMAAPEVASPTIQRTKFLCASMPLDGSLPLASPEVASPEIPYVELRNLPLDYHVPTLACSARTVIALIKERT